MVGKQIKKREIKALLGEQRAQTVLDSLNSTGNATISEIAKQDLKEISNYFQDQGYKVDTIAENMDDENPTYSLMIKKPAVQIFKEFETESEFRKEYTSLKDILGEQRAETVLDSLNSTGNATISGVAGEDLMELSNYFENQGYRVVTMAETMKDEHPTYSLMVKKPVVQIFKKFETESEFRKPK